MFTLGIDVGGTYARAAVVDAEGRLVTVAKQALLDRRPEAVVDAVGHAAERALAAAPGAEIRGCGVGFAAQLDPLTGTVRVAPNLGWRDVPLGAMLAARLGRSVALLNDLSAAAYGELCAGAGRGEQNLLTVFVGSGVGSAIIANGHLVSGAGGVAGELGHVKVVVDGRLCGCGERGCVEAYAGGHNLIAQCRERVASGTAPRLAELCGNDLDALTPVLLERAALEGDPPAREIWERARDLLALAIANAVTTVNPARLILGGGVLSRCPALRQGVVEGIGRLAARVSQVGFTIVDAQLGDDSGLMGAGLLAAAIAKTAG